MLDISRARSVADEQIRIAPTIIDGIGPEKAIMVCYRLGISGKLKIKELTKYHTNWKNHWSRFIWCVYLFFSWPNVYPGQCVLLGLVCA